MAKIKLKEVKNIRDLEGMKTASGMIQKNKLIRSSKLTDAKDSDIELLQNKYQIKIDLTVSA